VAIPRSPAADSAGSVNQRRGFLFSREEDADEVAPRGQRDQDAGAAGQAREVWLTGGPTMSATVTARKWSGARGKGGSGLK
jgi:hypothetical protein